MVFRDFVDTPTFSSILFSSSCQSEKSWLEKRRRELKHLVSDIRSEKNTAYLIITVNNANLL